MSDVVTEAGPNRRRWHSEAIGSWQCEPVMEALAQVDAVRAEAAATSTINPLLMSWAIDDHVLAWPATEPMHDGGTCSTDCAADIGRRYDLAAKKRATDANVGAE